MGCSEESKERLGYMKGGQFLEYFTAVSFSKTLRLGIIIIIIMSLLWWLLTAGRTM